MGILFEDYKEYKKLYWVVKQALIPDFRIFDIEEDKTLTVIEDTIKLLKDLTRGQDCTKMCIIQDLLGGCNKCEHKDYCTTYGKALR